MIRTSKHEFHKGYKLNIPYWYDGRLKYHCTRSKWCRLDKYYDT